MTPEQAAAIRDAVKRSLRGYLHHDDRDLADEAADAAIAAHLKALEAAGYELREKPCRYGSPTACGRKGGPYSCPDCIPDFTARPR